MRKLLALVLSSLLVATPAFADRTVYAPVRLAPTATAGTVLFADGTAAAPSMSFSADPDTGVFRPGNNQLGATLGGTVRMYLFDRELYIGNGYSNAAPASGGIYGTRGSGTNIAGANFVVAGGVSTGTGAGGALIFQTSPAGSSGSAANTLTERMRITSSGQIQIGDGTEAVPVMSFSGDTDTGFYRVGSNQIGMSLGGTTRVALSGQTIYVGNGTSSATPASGSIYSTSASGTDISGNGLSLSGGESTGTGTGGSIYFKTSSASTTGSAPNYSVSRWSINYLGNLIQDGTNGGNLVMSKSTTKLDVAGAKFRLPQGTTIPATCEVGELFDDTDSNDCANTAGGDGALCICKTANTWVLISNF